MNSSDLFFSGQDSFYKTKLLPVLEKLEAKRITLFKKIGFYISFVLALFIISLFVESVVFIIITLIGMMIIFFGSIPELLKDYTNNFKKQVFPIIIKYYDETFIYNSKGWISKQSFVKSSLYWTNKDNKNNKKTLVGYCGEDYIEGKIGKTKLCLSELNSQVKQYTGKDRSGNPKYIHYPLFNGLFIIADFNKHIQAKTFIYPDRAERILGSYGKFFQKFNKPENTDLIHLEDPVFEKYFKVFGEDQNQSRYILSPSFMNRLVKFREKSGLEMKISLLDSNINIAINDHEDILRPRLFESATNINIIKIYLEELDFCLGIVEDLNLNLRIWSKD